MRRRTTTIAVAVAGVLVVAGSVALVSEAAQGSATRCRVDYTVTNQWARGFSADVSVTNLGDPVTSWTVGWTWPSGQRITSVANGTATTTDTAVRVASQHRDAPVPTGGTASFSFDASWKGANTAPTSFRLNGRTCTTGDPSATSVPSTPTTTASAADPVAPAAEPSASPTAPDAPDATTGTPSGTPDAPTAAAPTATETVAGARFYVNPDTQAYRAAAAATGETKRLLDKIAQTPQAFWVDDWNGAEQARAEVRDYTTRAVAAGKTPVVVVYAIPGRDCGWYSQGGIEQSRYAAWVDAVADSMVGHPWVVLEPDALPQIGTCDGQGDRAGYLRYAAKSLTERAGARVYLEIGNSAWLTPDQAAEKLDLVGFDHAAGFAFNTSNFQPTDASRAWGEQVSARVGGKPFVIDTSRNGNGGDGGNWCNPAGRALGERPRVVGERGLDALLWVKLPGESDGPCNGGPEAGTWWEAGALELARNAAW
ncbi:glycoside hydrolase family 6 protein [Cellulomonas sp. P22]|uniref:glycoside hydrolase family 6 protein n=1 Tax=Cellulomonas sp. P22 TaxID=3373189 RepID=UPI0037938C8F